MYSYRLSLQDKWIHLNIKSLIIAKKVGIDVSDILNKKDGKYISNFIDRRNKIAHGDLVGYSILQQKIIHKPETFDDFIEISNITEKQALDQIKRSYNFIKKWAETNPTIILGKMETIDEV